MINLLFRADLDGKGVYGAIAKMRSAFQGVGGGIGGAVGKAGESIASSLKGQLLGILGVGAVLHTANAAIDRASKVMNASDAFGLSPEFIQRMQYASDLSETTIEEVLDANKRLQRSRIEALGGDTGKMGDFARIGIKEKELKSLHDGEKLWFRFADAIQAAASGGKNLDASMSLLGKGTSSNVLAMMSNDMRSLANDADKFGRVVKTSLLLELSQAGDQVDDLKNKVNVETTKATGTAWKWGKKVIAGAVATDRMMAEVLSGGTKGEVIGVGLGAVGEAIQNDNASKADREKKLNAIKWKMYWNDWIAEHGGESDLMSSKKAPSGGGTSYPDRNVDAFAKLGMFVGGHGYGGMGGMAQDTRDTLKEMKDAVTELKAIQATLKNAL